MRNAMKFPIMLAASAASASLLAQTPPDAETLWQMLQEQQAEIESLKSQLQDTGTRVDETQMMALSVADAMESAPGTTGSDSWTDYTRIGGYGEHHYNITEQGRDQIDAHRYVLYISHDYSDSVHFFSEWELEHSLAGEGKPGEVELEQAYIDWRVNEDALVRIGQQLIPVGILNETHEPDTFYGVERNRVESEIIPATWWETGVLVQGELNEGLQYDLAVHSGLNLSDDSGAIDTFRIRSGRQKSAEANANSLAYTARLSYTGIPGLRLAATAQYQSDLLQNMVPNDEASATLLESHLVYQGERLGLRALYAQWNIENQTFETNSADVQTGWYVEPSLRVSDQFGLFARYTELDPSRGDRPTSRTEQLDLGFNYWVHPQVVLKADYERQLEGGTDAVNLGIGWSY